MLAEVGAKGGSYPSCRGWSDHRVQEGCQRGTVDWRNLLGGLYDATTLSSN